MPRLLSVVARALYCRRVAAGIRLSVLLLWWLCSSTSAFLLPLSVGPVVWRWWMLPIRAICSDFDVIPTGLAVSYFYFAVSFRPFRQIRPVCRLELSWQLVGALRCLQRIRMDPIYSHEESAATALRHATWFSVSLCGMRARLRDLSLQDFSNYVQGGSAKELFSCCHRIVIHEHPNGGCGSPSLPFARCC